jgi:hypothetical protein
VIQQAWTSKTLPTSWTEVVLCPVYMKGDKLDLPLERDKQNANAAVHHYQNGFQSGKSTQDQLFALRKILEKCNEFNITTHHLFINFKSAYDTIIRKEVHVGMSELNVPIKLIRLTKATLTIVTCCVKIQNNRSESFETRQGLRS